MSERIVWADCRETDAIYQPGGKLQLVTDRLLIPETPIYLDLPTLFAALD